MRTALLVLASFPLLAQSQQQTIDDPIRHAREFEMLIDSMRATAESARTREIAEREIRASIARRSLLAAMDRFTEKLGRARASANISVIDIREWRTLQAQWRKLVKMAGAPE